MHLYLPTFRSQATIASEKSTVFTFYYTKAYVTNFDLAVKLVKVNPWSSFDQTMMYPRHKCYIPSFVDIGPLVPEKKIFVYGHGGHLGHVTCIMFINFYYHVPKSLHIKFG